MGNFAFPNLASPVAPAPPPITSNARGTVTFVGEEITVTSGQLTLNALFGSIKIPKGAVIIGASLKATDLDTDGTPAIVLAVGDSVDDDRLITAATVGQASGYTNTLAAAGYAYQYTAETTVQVKVTTAPDVAAGGTITYGVTYVSP